MRIDLHTHSRISDGEDTPTALVAKASQAELDVIALTDHDTFAGVAEAQEAGKRMGVKVLAGIELSTQVDGRPVHVLGYGCDPHDAALAAELRRLRDSRRERMPMMCARLTEAGLPLTAEDVYATVGAPVSVGRPHVADAMVAKGYVATRDEAFEKWLALGKPGYVQRYAIDVGDGIDLLHAARGVAVLAHPWSRGNRDTLPAPLIQKLQDEHGLDGIEVDHEDHDMHTRSLLMEMGARMGLIRTGSSDYHGIGKPAYPLGVNMTRPSAYRELVARIRERGGII